MYNKLLIGTIFGGALIWLAKVVYDSHQSTKQIIKRGEELAKEMDELIKTAKIDLSQCEPSAKKCLNTLDGSIQMARDVGVPEEEILHNIDEIDNFFLGEES